MAYGMSECTGACAVPTPQYYERGSCGAELPGVKVKSFKVDEKDFCKKEECPRASSWQGKGEKFPGASGGASS